jgi:hypothetical protein
MLPGGVRSKSGTSRPAPLRAPPAGQDPYVPRTCSTISRMASITTSG